MKRVGAGKGNDSARRQTRTRYDRESDRTGSKRAESARSPRGIRLAFLGNARGGRHASDIFRVTHSRNEAPYGCGAACQCVQRLGRRVSRAYDAALVGLVNAYTAARTNPSADMTAEIGAARAGLDAVLSASQSNRFAPSQIELMNRIGAIDLFGRRAANRASASVIDQRPDQPCGPSRGIPF